MSASDPSGDGHGYDETVTETVAGPEDWKAKATRGVLRLTLTEPEFVPMTEEQHQQAVVALSAMILDWVRRQAQRTGTGDGFDL